MGNQLLSDLMLKLSVWAKGQICPGYDPSVWRRDSKGSVIRFSDYGNRDSEYGWEKDHIDPNGPDELWNLQPLHWLNNVRKSDQPIGFLSTLLGGTRK